MQPFLMRSAFVLISTLSMYSPSLGQDYYRSQAPLSQRTAPARSSDLGGGLIEFLVEGSAPAPSRRWTNGSPDQNRPMRPIRRKLACSASVTHGFRSNW